MGEAENIYFTCLKFLLKKKNNHSANMQLFVRGYLGVHTVDVTGFESVESLRNHVCQLEGIDEVENQILNLNGSPLIEEEPLSACGLGELATIEMTSRLFGGKVHGSLARAGKVKGQTSKVEKQEKKKKNPIQPQIRQRRCHFRQEEGTQLQLGLKSVQDKDARQGGSDDWRL